MDGREYERRGGLIDDGWIFMDGYDWRADGWMNG